jgi:hypothetical protein
MECLEKNPERNIHSDDPATCTASIGNKAVTHSPAPQRLHAATPELA